MIRSAPLLVLAFLVGGCGPGNPPAANQAPPPTRRESIQEFPKDDDRSVIVEAPPTLDDEPSGVAQGAEGIKIDKNGFEITGEDAQIRADKNGLKIKAPDVDVEIGDTKITAKELGVPLYPGLAPKGGVKALADGKKLVVAEGTTKDDDQLVVNFYRGEIVSPTYRREGEKRIVEGKNDSGDAVEIQIWSEKGLNKVRVMSTRGAKS